MKIAVLRYRFVGDTVLSLPFLAALRQQYPQAEIHYFTGQDSIGLMQFCPSVDSCEVFEPRHGFLKALKQLRRHRYDKVYVMKRSLSSALLARLSGAKETIGFATEGRSLLLSQSVPYQPQQGHEAQHFLSVLKLSELASVPELKQLFPTLLRLPLSMTQTVRSRLQQAECPKPWVVIQAGSTHPAKCWPKSSYEDLLRKMDTAFTSGTVVLIGIQSERELAQAILDGAALENLVGLNWCGETTLVETHALLMSSDVLLSGDSGVMHMAALAGLPQVALFGPSDDSQWKPLSEKATVLKQSDLDCQPCRLNISCDNVYPCLNDLSPDRVFEAINLKIDAAVSQ